MRRDLSVAQVIWMNLATNRAWVSVVQSLRLIIGATRTMQSMSRTLKTKLEAIPLFRLFSWPPQRPVGRRAGTEAPRTRSCRRRTRPGRSGRQAGRWRSLRYGGVRRPAADGTPDRWRARFLCGAVSRVSRLRFAICNGGHCPPQGLERTHKPYK